MAHFTNTDRQVAAVTQTGLGAAYVVAADPGGLTSHQAGRVGTLSYRAEATFKAATTLTSQTFKVQVSRTGAEPTDAASALWTDLAVADAKAPATAPAVEWTVAAQAGKTVGLDLFAEQAHRGRAYFRVLTKAAGTAAAGDAFTLWGPR